MDPLEQDSGAPENAPALPRHESCIAGGFAQPTGPIAKTVRESVLAADRLPDPPDSAEVADAASQNGAGDVASARSFLPFLLLLLLPFCQNQQLHVGR